VKARPYRRKLFVVLACAFALGLPAVCLACPFVEITTPDPEPGKFIKGDTDTFACTITGGCGNDFWLIWTFYDGTGDVQEGKNLTSVQHYMPYAGKKLVDVELWDFPKTEQFDADIEWFWVLWVDVELVSTGDCPSTDNDKRDVYKAATRPNPPGRYTLGLGDFMTYRHGWGVAVHGDVTPSDWDTGDPIYLYQTVDGKTYKGIGGDILNDVMSGDDTRPDYRDHTAPELYLMDYPGVRHNSSGSEDDHILRIRANFTNVAKWDGRVCSNEVQWWTAQSWHKEGEAWVTFDDEDVNPSPGDNQTVSGESLDYLTWDMYAP